MFILIYNKTASISHALGKMGFPDRSAGKESDCNAGDPGSVPGLGNSAGEGKGYPLRYSGLENLYSPWGREE